MLGAAYRAGRRSGRVWLAGAPDKAPYAGAGMRQGRQQQINRQGLRPVCACLAVLLVAGCLGQGDGNTVSRMLMPDAAPLAEGLAQDDAGAESAVLRDLKARRSALPRGSAYRQIADAVLVADSRAAGAELRSARLRARAQSRNWLPSLGPQVSLTSLGAVVATLVVEQVLFDNGRKLAERDFAKADVEVAAVALVQDSNARVLTALGLFLAAGEAQARVALAQASERDMAHFEWIMSERVAGGISDRSDLMVLQQKLAEIRASQATQAEAARVALTELAGMGVQGLDGVRAELAGPLGLPSPAPAPLSVALAEAELSRAQARARAERAGFLPGLTATGVLGRNAADPSVDMRMAQPLGFGTGDALRALEAATEGERRKVDQTREEASRRLTRLAQERDALIRQAAEAAVLSSRAKANLDLFQSQYDAGQRQVMDVVGLYEQFARQQESTIALRYRAAAADLELAAALGVLADGDQL